MSVPPSIYSISNKSFNMKKGTVCILMLLIKLNNVKLKIIIALIEPGYWYFE